MSSDTRKKTHPITRVSSLCLCLKVRACLLGSFHSPDIPYFDGSIPTLYPPQIEANGGQGDGGELSQGEHVDEGSLAGRLKSDDADFEVFGEEEPLKKQQDRRQYACHDARCCEQPSRLGSE